MTTSWSYEFQRKHFGFSDCTSQRFYELQCGSSKIGYLVYRIIVFLYTLAWIIADVASINQPDYWIFLTNWTEVTCCLYFLLALIVLAYSFTTQSQTDHKLLWLHKITWIVFSTALSAALVTDIVFWALLSSRLSTSAIVEPFNIHSHAINYLLLVIDLLINSIPIRLLHFVYSMGYGLTYAVFTLILHGANFNSAIYPVLDWENSPGISAGLTLGTSFVALPIAHVVSFGLYHLRGFLYRNCCHNDRQTTIYDDHTTDAMEMGGESNKAFEQGHANSAAKADNM